MGIIFIVMMSQALVESGETRQREIFNLGGGPQTLVVC